MKVLILGINYWPTKSGTRFWFSYGGSIGVKQGLDDVIGAAQ